MTEPNKTCSTCGRRFARSTHLRRHEATHQQAGHCCQFCGKGFARRDVARRHAKACVSRTEGDEVDTAKRGRKPRACDGCVSSKLACDSRIPCGRCSAKGLSCTSSRSRGIPSESGELLSANKTHTKPSFFLALTDPTLPSANDFLATEEVDPASTRSTQWDRVRQDQLGAHASDPRLFFLGFGGAYEDPLMPGWELPEVFDGFNPSSFLFDIDSNSGNLKTRLDLLNLQLKQINESNETGTCLPTQSTTYDGFLTEANVLQCASAFFRCWHHQWPMVHWPSFDLDKATLPLLLAIALTGAAFTPPGDFRYEYHLLPRACYETAEVYIFKQLEIFSLPGQPCSNMSDAIQVCQAALLIETLQSSVNDGITRSRVITTRHPILIAAVRRLGLFSLKHTYDADNLNWDQFIQIESSIRVVTWTFLADTLMTTFCSYPPSISVWEMTGDLPCDDKLWDATNEAEFKSEWFSQASVRQPLSVRQIITELMADEWPAILPACYSRLNVNHLYTVIWALQPNIFALRTMALSISYKVILVRAVQRWIGLWRDVIKSLTPSQCRKVTGSLYASELAWLTLKILGVTGTEEANRWRYFQVISSEDTANLHEFIKANLPVEEI